MPRPEAPPIVSEPGSWHSGYHGAHGLGPARPGNSDGLITGWAPAPADPAYRPAGLPAAVGFCRPTRGRHVPVRSRSSAAGPPLQPVRPDSSRKHRSRCIEKHFRNISIEEWPHPRPTWAVTSCPSLEMSARLSAGRQYGGVVFHLCGGLRRGG